MKLTLSNNDCSYLVDYEQAKSIAIPLDFDGLQPNHFGVPDATESTYEADGFVGNTERGGSCNVTTISTVPHCNGTHTETVHHIVDQPVLINDVLPKRLMVAVVVSVKPVSAKNTTESYRPVMAATDRVLTRDDLERCSIESELPLDAIVIRTLPNDSNKKRFRYGNDNEPAFFTIEAMEWIVEKGFEHLLVDMPSIDKMYDQGKLTCHHLFWNVPEGTHALTEMSWTHKTITEMIFVPDEIIDGVYALQCHAPSFCLDAAPSNPILFPLKKQ
jgi:arylformamidase